MNCFVCVYRSISCSCSSSYCLVLNQLQFGGLAYQGKDIVFRVIIEFILAYYGILGLLGNTSIFI